MKPSKLTFLDLDFEDTMMWRMKDQRVLAFKLLQKIKIAHSRGRHIFWEFGDIKHVPSPITLEKCWNFDFDKLKFGHMGIVED